MPLIYNGTTITGSYTVKYGNTSLTKIIYNGQTVWEKITSRTYKYGAQGALNPALNQYGNVSGYNASNPTAGGGTISAGATGICWYFNKNVADQNGSGVTLYNCMQKTITSMKFVAYRNNTNTGAYGSVHHWVYGSYTTGGNTYYVSLPQQNGLNLVYRGNGTTINRTLPQPSAAGLIDQNLTTAELKDIFKNDYCRQYTGSTITIGVNNWPTYVGYTHLVQNEYYYGVGYRYTTTTQNPTFLFRNPANVTDAYVEIVANS